MTNHPYIDYQAGLSRVRNNQPLYLRLLGMFADSEEFQKLEDAIAAGDTDEAARAVHAIKGMSGNLALAKVFDITSRLLVQCRQNRVDPALVEEYRQALAETLHQIRDLIPSPSRS